VSAPVVVLDPNSGLAPWRQIHRQLVQLIGTVQLAAGSRLPTIRQLARDLGVSAGTVARVYRELEAVEAIVTASGRGAVVSDKAVATADPAMAAASTAAAAGADLDDAIAAPVLAWTPSSTTPKQHDTEQTRRRRVIATRSRASARSTRTPTTPHHWTLASRVRPGSVDLGNPLPREVEGLRVAGYDGRQRRG